MEATIVAALIASAASVAVALITTSLQNAKSQAVMLERIDSLTAEVEKHNNVVERVYKLEERSKTLFARYAEVHEATQGIAETARHAHEKAEAAHRRLDRSGVDSN